jgi:hypothetical protein
MSDGKAIYGMSSNGTCPEPPVGNKDAVLYLSRLQNILVQLNASKDKNVASTRLGLLIDEIRLAYPLITPTK